VVIVRRFYIAARRLSKGRALRPAQLHQVDAGVIRRSG